MAQKLIVESSKIPISVVKINAKLQTFNKSSILCFLRQLPVGDRESSLGFMESREELYFRYNHSKYITK